MTRTTSPVLAELAAQVTVNTDVEASATQALNGVADRIQAAVDAALENGATAEELQPVTDEVTALRDSANNLAAAVAANT